MARYRKIDTRIQNDQKFKVLSNEAKLVFFTLLTHPNLTVLGAMRNTLPGLACEMGWDEKAFRKAFQELSHQQMVTCDEKAFFIGLPNFLKYNCPESPNVVKSWVYALDDLPECLLKSQLIQNVKAFVGSLPKAFQEALPKAFDQGWPNQQQEHKQQHKQEQGQTVGKSSHEMTALFSTSVPDAQPPLAIPLQNGSDYVMTPTHIDEWQTLYPDVNILQTLKNIRAWNVANPTKRKTVKGILKHINRWLANEQRQGRYINPSGSTHQLHTPTLLEHNQAIANEWLQGNLHTIIEVTK